MSERTGELPEELQVLAGEYVLGVLDAAEMRAVRRRAMGDAAFAAAIAGWERRLAPMVAAVPVLPPPDALWARIEEAVAPLPLAPGEDALVAPVGLSASRQQALLPGDPALAGRARSSPPRRRAWPWQLATVASLALAAGIAAVALLPKYGPGLGAPPALVARAASVLAPPPAEQPEARLALLMPPDSHSPGFMVRANADGSVVLVAMAGVEVPSGHDLELWILRPGGTAPAPLGVLPAVGRRLTLPQVPPSGTKLMVSVEPPGGSKTGAPTGPVVYAGSLGQISL